MILVIRKFQKEVKLNFINKIKNLSESLRESHAKLSKTSIADVLISVLVFNKVSIWNKICPHFFSWLS